MCEDFLGPSPTPFTLAAPTEKCFAGEGFGAGHRASLERRHFPAGHRGAASGVLPAPISYVFATSKHNAARRRRTSIRAWRKDSMIAEALNTDFRQDASRHADSGVARRHVGQNERARGDRRFVPDRYRPENTGVGGDVNVIADFRGAGGTSEPIEQIWDIVQSTPILVSRVTRTCEACWMSRPAPISASG